MMRSRIANKRTQFHAGFTSRRTGSLLEIKAAIPSEINAISPLVERVMLLIEGAHCVAGEEFGVELAPRETLNNDVRTIPDPLADSNLEAEHGRGFHLVKSMMDLVSFERRGTEVHMCKRPACNSTDALGDSRSC